MKSHLNTNSESKSFIDLRISRTRILRKMLGLAILFIIFIFLGLFSYINNAFIDYIWIPIIACILLIVLFVLQYVRFISKNAQELSLYLLDMNFPDLEYHSDKHISTQDFINSQLYDEVEINSSGNNYIKHKSWKASNLNVQAITTKPSDNGATVFNGSFFVINTDNKLDYSLIIKPKPIGEKIKLPLFLVSLLNPYFHPINDKVITNENHFNDLFDAYSEDSEQAKSFLNTNRIQRILNIHYLLKHLTEKQQQRKKNRIFKSPFDQPLYALEFCFSKGQIYMAIRGQDLFGIAAEKEEGNNESYLHKMLNELLTLSI